MSDSLLERFAAVAPADDRSDWVDVRKRARRRRIRVPIVLAAALAALVVAAPAVGLVALLTDNEPPVWIIVRITVTPRGAAVTGDAHDDRIRTVVLALEGRPQRRQAVPRTRTFFFRLSTKDFGRCGSVYGLDARGRRIAAAFVPPVPKHLPTPPKDVQSPPPSGEVFVDPATRPRC